MADLDQTANEKSTQELLQEQYLKSMDGVSNNSIVTGEIIGINQDDVLVDVGLKSDGIISLSEFDGQDPPKVGDKIQVMVVQTETSTGGVVVSKRKADAQGYRTVLKEAETNGSPIKGKITKIVKGGFEVDLGSGYTAFLPISKTDVIRVEEQEPYIGVEGYFKIEKLVLEGRKTNIVVNRRDLLVEENTKNRDKFFETAEIGDDIEGVVKSFTSFGAFIDLGGFDGLLHVNDMSWGHVTKPKDFVKKGQKIKVKVIRLEPEEKRINLSLKHFSEDPWARFEDNFAEGDVVPGVVTKLADFGAFIEIGEGIEGLAHISELSWVKRIKHPREILNVGDEVQVKILAFDIQQGRVSLGLKQVSNNPWDTLDDKYPKGKVLELEVKKITTAGAFLELEEGIDGFLHADDYSWTKKIKNLSSVMKEGDVVKVQIIDFDTENRRIRLGVKQLEDDPWSMLATAYPRGSVIQGEVTNITDFGVFLKVVGDIEGLIAKVNLCNPKDESPDEYIKKISVGDTIKCVVMEVNVERQKLSLSIRDYVKKQQESELSRYIDDKEETAFTLGDIIKNKD